MGKYEDYEQEYKQWKKSGKALTYDNSFAAETTYTDGRGFDCSSRNTAENKALSNCVSIIGIALLVLMVLETLGSASVNWILSLTGHCSRYEIYSGSFTSAKLVTSLAYIIFGVVKLGVPILILKLYSALPASVILNTGSRKTGSTPLYLMIVLLSFGLAAGLSGIYPGNGIQIGCFSDAVKYFSYANTSLLFLNAFFSIFAVSFLYTVFIHGIILRLLLQFGERFAVILTAAISILTMHQTNEILPTLMIAYFSAACTVKCGSIFPVFWGRTLYCWLCFIIYYAKYVLPDPLGKIILFSIVIASVAIGITVLIYALLKNKMRSFYFPPSPKSNALYIKTCFSPAFAAAVVFAIILLLYDILQLYM